MVPKSRERASTTVSERPLSVSQHLCYIQNLPNIPTMHVTIGVPSFAKKRSVAMIPRHCRNSASITDSDKSHGIC